MLGDRRNPSSEPEPAAGGAEARAPGKHDDMSAVPAKVLVALGTYQALDHGKKGRQHRAKAATSTLEGPSWKQTFKESKTYQDEESKPPVYEGRGSNRYLHLICEL